MNSKAKDQNHKFSDFFYNWITYTGVFLAYLIFIVEIFLFFFDFFSPTKNVYLGIFTYAVLPVFLILGLILIPIGAVIKRRRVLKGTTEAKPKTFYIDPSIPTHRNAIFVFVFGTVILMMMTAVGSYKAYQYTESVKFCGMMCHKVMKPEYTVYLNSPHARVKCVECHIGEGADWYVKAKISGLRQIYHTIKGDYSRPIKTPVHNLRPASETCEKCHWPGQFYSSVEVKKTYFPVEDGEYSKWLLRMLIHVGRSPDSDVGIHAHMYLDNDIYFAAEDEKLQEITWVKSVDKDGAETIFTTSESKWKDDGPSAEMIHKMDCMDCHNRPTHHFHSPDELVDEALRDNKIDPSLPSIKSKAMELMSDSYSTEEDAVEKIPAALKEYYQKELNKDYAKHEKNVEQAAETIVNMFKGNIFPEMKARWDAFPDNIGHLTSPGCFRCHDGEHESSTGKIITRDCNVCHVILEQGPPGDVKSSTQGLPFVHPFEDDGLWEDMNCTDCHTGN